MYQMFDLFKQLSTLNSAKGPIFVGYRSGFLGIRFRVRFFLKVKSGSGLS